MRAPTTLFALLAVLASGAAAQTSQTATKTAHPTEPGLFQYQGQDAPNSPTFQLLANGQAKAAQTLFLNDLDPETISFFDFEETAPAGISALNAVPDDSVDFFNPGVGSPPRSSAALLLHDVTARFRGYGSDGQIPADVLGRNGAVVRFNGTNPPTNRLGTYPTSGNSYLYAVGYDGSALSGTNPPDGTTQTALSLRFNSSRVEAGRTGKRFSAFGAYITDTEGYGTVRLVLTKSFGGGTVTVDYDGILNQGRTTTDRGNGQTTFIGFADFNSRYDRIDVLFTNRKTPTSGSVVTNEAFGFDDFVVGEINQVLGEDVASATARTLDQVDEPGWRLLSAPVRGVTVDDLAGQNLVQGVAAGATTPAQYPDAAGSNLYIAYGGGTRFDYTPVATTDFVLRPGRGFWWYWYDQAFTPVPGGAGGGTSASVELDNFQLTASGPELLGEFAEEFDDNTDCSSDVNVACPAPRVRNQPPPASTETPNGPRNAPEPVTPEDDDFYMVGNPFTFPMDFSALSASGGTMAAQGFIWNPGSPSGLNPRTNENTDFDGPGTYEIVFETLPPTGPFQDDDPEPQSAIAVWNGMLIEVAKDETGATATTVDDPGTPVTFTFDPTVAVTSEDPPFHGKDGTPEAALRFALFGETASGARTRDEAAWVRFRDDATSGWDRMDSAKPDWPGGAVGLIAAMGTRGGEPRAQAVMSLPHGAASVPLSVKITEAGTYDLVWRSAGLSGTLRDLDTGDVIDLSAERYTFTAEGTGSAWTPRFALDAAAAVDGEEGPAPEVFVGQPSPNPARGAFRLDVQAGAAATVTVYDALGRRVAEQPARASGEAVRVTTEGFAPGAYLVVVEAPGVREVRRLTVVR